jgi:hypothetical protein
MTPCECGWDYRNYSIETLQERVGMFAMILAFKRRNPDAVFSTFSEKETEDDRRFMEFIGAWEKKE